MLSETEVLEDDSALDLAVEYEHDEVKTLLEKRT